MRIEIEIRSVYGETKYYPSNDTARGIAAIARTKTLTRDAIASAIKFFGAEVWEMNPRTGTSQRIPHSEFGMGNVAAQYWAA